MLKDKVIEPTKPERYMWNSWVVLVPKKAADGSWSDMWMCVNYRPANTVTESDSYPIGDCAAKFYGRVLSFLAVIDPYSFGLVILVLLFVVET